MADKYIGIDGSGNKQEVEGLVVSAGAGDTGKIPALDASGRLDNSMMPTGIGADTKSITANEGLSAGDIVNVFDNTGEEVRKADATTAGKEAMGFVLSAYTATQSATVYFEGTITGLVGLTPGTVYFLNTTAGGVTATPPATTGNVLQKVGVAISATELSFEPGEVVIRA